MPHSCAAKSFQSTPSAWRETTSCPDNRSISIISIHSLRMEGDTVQPILFVYIKNFNPLPPHGGRPFISRLDSQKSTISIHSLRMEGDFAVVRFLYPVLVFQSTPSAWRETGLLYFLRLRHTISIHSLRMEGDLRCDDLVHGVLGISIHSLRMEGDSCGQRLEIYLLEFQSTPSAWRETSIALDL